MMNTLRGLGALASYAATKLHINFRRLIDPDFAQQFAETAHAMTEYAQKRGTINEDYEGVWPLVEKTDALNQHRLAVRMAVVAKGRPIGEVLDDLEAGYKNTTPRFSLREFWAGGQGLPDELYPIERELRAKPEAKVLFDKTVEDMGTLKAAFVKADAKSYPFPYGLVAEERDANARFLLLHLAVDARNHRGPVVENLQRANDGYNDLIKQYG